MDISGKVKQQPPPGISRSLCCMSSGSFGQGEERGRNHRQFINTESVVGSPKGMQFGLGSLSTRPMWEGNIEETVQSSTIHQAGSRMHVSCSSTNVAEEVMEKVLVQLQHLGFARAWASNQNTSQVQRNSGPEVMQRKNKERKSKVGIEKWKHSQQ